MDELLGRVEEMALLRGFLTSAATDGGCLVLSGDPGVGKSALLDAAAREARAAGSLVLSAAGAQFESDLSFSALNQLFLPLHQQFDQLDMAHRAALSAALGLADGSPADRLVVSTAAVLLLRLAAQAQPLLLIVDDLPWVDRPSAAVLSFVARRLAGTRIGLLAAARAGDGGFFERAWMPGIEVGPLDEKDAEAVLSRRLPSLPVRVRRDMLAQAQGNPLALMELPAMASHHYAVGGSPVVAPTGRLTAHFASRVALLPAQARRLLLFAALHGHGDLRVIEASGLGPDGLDELVAAERFGLVVSHQGARRFEFRHPLVRSAVVAASTTLERRQAHHALATSFADEPERRAWHLAEAVTGPDEQVAGLIEDAAGRTLRRGDAVGAVGALLRAADLSPRGTDRSRRLARAAYVGAEVTGELRNVPLLLSDARQADVESNLHAATAASFLLYNGEGDVDTAHRLLVEAIATWTDRHDATDSMLVDALFTLLLVSFFGGRPELWPPLDAAITHLGRDVPDVLALASQTYADPVHAQPAAIDRLAAAISGLRDDTAPSRIVRIGIAAFWIDRLAGCRTALWRVVHDGRQGGAVASATQALLLLGFDSFHTGRWEEAQQLFDESVESSETNGYWLRTLPGRYGQALLAAARGDHHTTKALTDAMVQWATPRGIHAAIGYSHHARALCALGRGDFEDAYQQTVAVSPPGTFPSHVALALWITMDLVEAAVRTNRTAEAQAHVAAVQANHVADLSPRLALLALGSAAIAASNDIAAGLFREALAIPDADRWPFDHARVQLAFGERLRRRGAITESRVYLAAAQEVFVQLGARPWASRAADELRATGRHRKRARKPAGTPGAGRLTERELQIATLAAGGLTNKQIAERVFVSHRTVSDHLYQIFPKLGIISRAALRDALAARRQLPGPPRGEPAPPQAGGGGLTSVSGVSSCRG